MEGSVPVWAAVVVGALLTGTGGLVPYVTARAARGVLRRNRWVGIRTPATVSSDASWRSGHAAAARWMAGGGAALVAGGLAALGVAAAGAPRLAFAGVAASTGLLAVVLLVVGAVRADAAARATARASAAR